MKYLLIIIILFFLWAQAQAQFPLPNQETSLFAGSARCNTCHITRPGFVLVDSSGHDLTPSQLWRSTMMANAAKDPYWQAKVEAEVNENPHLKSIIEDKCTTCHIPIGRTQAIHDGSEYYSLDEALSDPLAMDGVSCTVCHQIQPDNLGQESSFSGGYIINDSRVIYGPYTDIEGDLMNSSVLYEPMHGPHMLKSELCATCHTLYTNYVDDNGEIAGSFPEQMPYFEWKASQYPGLNIQCQTCHVPAINEDIIISVFPQSGLSAKNPFYKHEFVGGNTFMLTMLRDNIDQIGVTATKTNFDSTIARTAKMLTQHTANLSLDITQESNWIFSDVFIENLTGHKFPTGYPGRRAWLHFMVINAQNDTIFESGAYDVKGRLQNPGDSYQQHYDVISKEDQVQVYESIMGDLNGQVTLTLLRAAEYLKDNRIPPIGFSKMAEKYEDIAIKGRADKDINFNENSSGSDRIRFAVNIKNESPGNFRVIANLVYQSVNPRDIDDLNRYQSAKVQTFLNYYEAASKIPFIVKSVQKEIHTTASGKTLVKNFRFLPNFPNPFNNTTYIPFKVYFESANYTLDIFNIQGQKVKTLRQGFVDTGEYEVSWAGDDDNGNPVSSGFYFVNLRTSNQNEIRKILLIK